MEILKKQYQLAALIVLLCIGTACEKDANVKLPAVPQKLVLVSFISPQDTIIRVSVTLSQPLYNNVYAGSFEPVSNAAVTISSALGSFPLAYDPYLKVYVMDPSVLKVVEGVTYKLDVSTPDGKHAEASTTIPQQNSSLYYTVPEDSTLLVCRWKDTPSNKDYYRILLQNSSFYLSYNPGNPTASDTVWTSYVSSGWMSDEEQDGQELSSPMQYSRRNIYTASMKRYVYLLHTSKEYYDYGMRLPLAQSGGEFFSEPAPMFTNVDGGFGVFAGYSSYKLTVP